MALSTILFVLFSLIGAINASADSKVLTLTQDTFNHAISSNSLIMVEFYAPWCGHCKSLAPEYEIAAEQLASTSAKLAKVDCTVEVTVCGEVGVEGYPTLKVYRDGNIGDYTKARTSSAIIEFMKKQMMPVLTVLKSKADLEALKNQSSVVSIAFFENNTTQAFKAFNDVATKLRATIVFGVSFDAKLASASNATIPSVVIFKSFDEGFAIHPSGAESVSDASFTSESITSFITSNSMPLVADIGPENYMQYMQTNLPLGYLFVSSEEHKTVEGEALRAVAKEFKGKLNFVFIDANQFGGHATNLNLKESWPAFAIQDPKSNLKFPMDQTLPITQETLHEFVREFADGELHPSLKSAPLPPAAEEGHVHIIVGLNFDDVVMDKEKDVLVEFYAPWCGHCKQLAPIYDDLAASLAAVKTLVIAKMDATENDVPPSHQLEIDGFPTIKLFKAETNEIVDFEGERNLEGFISFLATNSHYTFDETIASAAAKHDHHEAEEHDEL